MTGSLPLETLRVLELGHIIAGPSAGLLLADLGADVIKVERPGEGDQTRGMPAGNGANFYFLNRNKRSITIDLKGSAEGRALFLRLARGSDVVIDNFAYGAVDTMGWANPLQIKRLVGAVRERWPDVPIKLHLHDTRALAIANVVAALEMGVDCFDSAVAGMGGCPFAAHQGAAGNVTTEDVVFLCQERVSRRVSTSTR